MGVIRYKRSGLTLIETILASTILCSAVLAIGAISTRSIADTELNKQFEMASSLLDKQLCIIDYMGIRNFIELGRKEGTFKGTEPEYSWQVKVEKMEISGLYSLKLVVSWEKQGKHHRVSVDSRFFADGI